MIRLQSGALVPASGADVISSAGAPAPVAAQMDDTGALGQPLVQDGAGPAAALASNVIAMTPHSTGGAARGAALIDTPRQPAVLQSEDPTSGSAGALAGLEQLGKLAGKSGDPLGPVSVTPAQVGSDGSSTSSGIMGFIKNLFHGSDAPAPPAAPEPAAAAPPMLPGPVQQQALPDLTPPPTAAGALGGDQNQGGIPVPTPRPALLTDRHDQVQEMPLTPIGTDRVNAAEPALPQPPGYFDRLKADPLRMALLTGGLQTMSAASRPGATALGSIGEGGLGGLKTVFSMQNQQEQSADDARKQALAEQKEGSEAQLRKAQGAFYDTRGTNDTTRADAALTTAGARVTSADAAKTTAGARVTSAEAARTRAEAMAKGGYGTKGQSVFQQKQSAWLAAHPGDTQGSLDYASGQKKLSGGDRLKSAYALANSEAAQMISPPPEGVDVWVDKRASDIADKISANDTAKASPPTARPGTPALGGAAAKPNSGALLSQARSAIAKGGDPAKVKARLKSLGGNPAEL